MDMFRLVVARPDDSLLHAGRYDPLLVVMSVCIAVFAAYTALLLSQRVAGDVRTSRRIAWTVAGGVCMGAGVWAMHFIGMLAFSLPCTVSYEPWITQLSVLPGILVSILAIDAIGRREISRARLLGAGGLFGLGIAAMHYLGMAAYRIDGLIVYDLRWVLLSLLLAVTLAAAALWVWHMLTMWQRWQAWAPFIGSLVLGAAVATLHYVAMAGSYFMANGADAAAVGGLQPTLMAVLVLLVTALVILAALAANFLTRPEMPPFSHILWGAGLAVLAWSGIAWQGADRYVAYQMEQVYQEARADSFGHVENTWKSIDHELARLRSIPEYFVGDPAVRTQLARFYPSAAPGADSPTQRRQRWSTDGGLVSLNEALIRATASLDVDTVSVLNAAGDCIASSTAGQTVDYVGESFASRQYFLIAKHGVPGQQYAVGQVSKEPGFFYSHPVIEGGRFLGAVVVKRDVSKLLHWIQHEQAFLVDANGVVVLSVDGRFDHRAVPGASVSILPAADRLRQYRREHFVPLEIRPWWPQRYPGIVHLDEQLQPVLLSSRSLVNDSMNVHVPLRVPELIQWDKDRPRLFLLLFTLGSMGIGSASILLIHRRRIRQAQDALRTSEQRFRDYAESASDWLWEMDADLRFSYFSENIESILNVPAGQLMLGRRRDEGASKDDLNSREKWDEHLHTLAQHLPFRNFEYQFQSPDGIRWFSINGVPYFDQNGRFLGYRGTGSNVTQRKETEARLRQAMLDAQTANEAKNSFLANISHEVRTPLNSIIGMAQLALRTELTAKQHDYLDKILRSARHQLQIITDILDFSKAEAGKFELEPVDFDFEQLMADVADYTRGAVEAKGLDLMLDVQPRFDIQLRGDPLRLKQVLMNYVSNAIKFTQRGSITVRARLVEETLFDYLLRFEVEDTGVGMDEAAQRLLFKPFHQVDSSMTRVHGGTGLGLAISKHLAELMGGEVGVQSRLGQGSTFWFTARLGRGAVKAAPAAVRENVPRTQWRLDGLHVLLAEDNAFNQMVASELLTQAGAEVTVADNGQEAVDLVQRQRFDCVLMDVQMPVMDGLQATRAIRATQGVAEIPIIGLSANVDEKSRAQCAAAGMDDFVGKPIDLDELFAVLGKSLGRATPDTGGASAITEVFDQAKTAQGEPDAFVEQVVDLEGFARNLSLELGEVREYVDMFVDTMNEILAEIEGALQQEDASALSPLGHKAKSVARTFDAKKLGSLCEALEGCKQADDLPRARGLVADIQVEMGRVSAQLERELA